MLDIEPRDDDGPAQWCNPGRDSALAQLWPALRAETALPPANAASSGVQDEAADAEDAALPQTPLTRRLSLEWTLPTPPAPIAGIGHGADTRLTTPAFDWAHATAAAIGTIAHRMLAQIAGDGVDAWDAKPNRVAGERERIMAELAGEGVPADERADATAHIEAAVVRTLADARGRWLFEPGHADARSEWALAGFDGDALRHVTIDRTFVADGVRWIVDFKTGRHEGSETGAFLDRECDRYRAQLERYAPNGARIRRTPDPAGALLSIGRRRVA